MLSEIIALAALHPSDDRRARVKAHIKRGDVFTAFGYTSEACEFAACLVIYRRVQRKMRRKIVERYALLQYLVTFGVYAIYVFSVCVQLMQIIGCLIAVRLLRSAPCTRRAAVISVHEHGLVFGGA